MDLDHVALALHDVSDTLHLLVERLGARVLDGGQSVGFRIVQVRLGRVAAPGDPGEGMTIELMEPWSTDRFDFLERFLAANGEGAHHLTFKVSDIRAELDRLSGLGLEPVRTQLTNPWWREAFFHPRDAHGTVVQIAESRFAPELAPAAEDAGSSADDGEFGSVEWWPGTGPRAEPPGILRAVMLRTTDPAGARTFFTEVLRGTESEDGPVTGDGATFAWPGGGRIVVERGSDGPAGIARLDIERPGHGEDIAVGSTRLAVHG